MKKILCLSAVLLLLIVGVALGIQGWPVIEERLNVALGVVTRITATTYQPAGAGTVVHPVLIQLNGVGYYRLDPYTSVAASNFTPTVNDYRSTLKDVIEVERPEYFRITPATAAFSAPTTSFSR